jgi:hypothetical protein
MSANPQSLMNQSQSAIPTVQGNVKGTAHDRNLAKYANNTSGSKVICESDIYGPSIMLCRKGAFLITNDIS